MKHGIFTKDGATKYAGSDEIGDLLIAKGWKKEGAEEEKPKRGRPAKVKDAEPAEETEEE